jgi:hypothetical protein
MCVWRKERKERTKDVCVDPEDSRYDSRSGVSRFAIGTLDLFNARRKNGMHVARSGASVFPGEHVSEVLVTL